MEYYFFPSLVVIVICALAVSCKKKTALDWTLAAAGLFVGIYLVIDLWKFSLANEPFWTILATLAFIAAVAWGIRQHFRRRRNHQQNQPTINIHNHPS
jgi:positive regulator of sigma E activity